MRQPAWATVIQGRAQYAASRYRRLQRWLSNDKVNPQAIYRPLIQAALAKWQQEKVQDGSSLPST